MKKVNSLLVADSVLALLDTRYFTDKENSYVETYSNGREQGYTIVATSAYHAVNGVPLKVSFAEARSSDQVVVRSSLDIETQEYFDTVDEAVNGIIKLFA